MPALQLPNPNSDLINTSLKLNSMESENKRFLTNHVFRTLQHWK